MSKSQDVILKSLKLAQRSTIGVVAIKYGKLLSKIYSKHAKKILALIIKLCAHMSSASVNFNHKTRKRISRHSSLAAQCYYCLLILTFTPRIEGIAILCSDYFLVIMKLVILIITSSKAANNSFQQS